MKNRNLVETRKLKNNVPIFICRRKCTPSMQKNEINRFYLWAILPDLNWKKESTHLPHQWCHWCGASCERDSGLFTNKFRREIV